jgi:hypothetical protein
MGLFRGKEAPPNIDPSRLVPLQVHGLPNEGFESPMQGVYETPAAQEQLSGIHQRPDGTFTWNNGVPLNGEELALLEQRFAAEGSLQATTGHASREAGVHRAGVTVTVDVHSKDPSAELFAQSTLLGMLGVLPTGGVSQPTAPPVQHALPAAPTPTTSYFASPQTESTKPPQEPYGQPESAEQSVQHPAPDNSASDEKEKKKKSFARRNLGRIAALGTALALVTGVNMAANDFMDGEAPFSGGITDYATAVPQLLDDIRWGAGNLRKIAGLF